MAHLSAEEEDTLMSAANDAEIHQHWYQAAILWRKLDEISCAEFCENILQYLAESNFEKLSRREGIQRPYPIRKDNEWYER